MAVYERTYHPYEGEITPVNRRYLVLPKYAFKDIFASKIFIAFLVACFIGPLIIAALIYVTNNSRFLEFVQATFGEQLRISFTATGYRTGFLIPQGILSFLMALIVGPTLVSRDLRNNALPLYLSRPFTRGEYILGKSAVLVIMLSAITWVPGLLLFTLQSYMQGFTWMMDNLRIAYAIFVGSSMMIVLLTLISLSLSAYMKWKTLAQAAFFGVFILTTAAGNIVNVLFRTSWGSLLNLGHMFVQVWASLFGVQLTTDVPDAAAWLSLLLFDAAFLLLLWRKIQAYEVVRS